MSTINDLDAALLDIQEVYGELGDVNDAVSRACEALEKLEKRLAPAVRLVQPPARSFEVTAEHVQIGLDILTAARQGHPADWTVRDILTAVFARLAEQTQAGGPDVTEADIEESQKMIKMASADRRNIVVALLEHDRARVSARTGGSPCGNCSP